MSDDDGITQAELTRWLRRVERKLDQAVGDHEKRLRRLEQWVYFAAGAGGLGAMSGLGALFGA